MPIRFLTSGESHGPALSAIVEGIPAGLPLTSGIINHQLHRRQIGYGSGGRMKIENDDVQILSGVMEGLTTGSPIGLTIKNLDHAKWKGKEISPFTIPRPGHVDLAGVIKYGYRDIRPALERASARETAARVSVGAICIHLLHQFDITIGAYVVSIGTIETNLTNMSFQERFTKAEHSDIRCPDQGSASAMRDLIRQTMQAQDTLGGIIEAVVLGVPPGLGSHVHWDRRLEGRIGAAVLSIPAVKGVEIGPAFDNTRKFGTQVHDPIRLQERKLTRLSDNSGGVEGGITTGQPMIIRAAMKPIATTLKPQQSVDLATGSEVSTQYERSDFCPVPRAVPILESMVAIILADALIEKLGGDSLPEMLPRFDKMRKGSLEDITMDSSDHVWWE